MKKLLLGLALLAFTCSASGQPTQGYESALANYSQLLRDGKLEDANKAIDQFMTYVRKLLDASKPKEAAQLVERLSATTAQAVGTNHIINATVFWLAGTEFFDKDRFSEAEPLFKSALAIAEQVAGSEDPFTSGVLTDLGRLYLLQKKYQDAQRLLERALRIEEKTGGPNHLDVAFVLETLARAVQEQGRIGEAENIYKRLIGILESSVGRTHMRTIRATNGLAVMYWVQERYKDAEHLLKTLLDTRQASTDTGYPTEVDLLMNLGFVIERQRRYPDAELYLTRAVGILEQDPRSDRLKLARIIHTLAIVVGEQKRNSEAEALYKRVIAVRKELLGETHIDTVSAMEGLAILYRAQGQHPRESEQLFRLVLSVRERHFGSEHKETVRVLNSLETLLQEQGRYVDALPLAKRLLSANEKSMGPDRPELAEAINRVAALMVVLGQYADAESLLKRAQAILEKRPDDAAKKHLLNTLVWLGLVSAIHGRTEEADVLFRRTLDISGSQVDLDDSPLRSVALLLLATSYLAQGRPEMAELIHQNTLDTARRAGRENDPSIVLTLEGLAGVYMIQARHDEAEALWNRALEIKERALGREHIDITYPIVGLAKIKLAQKKYLEAQSLLQRAISIQEKSLGSKNPSVAESLLFLAGAYTFQGNLAEAEPLFAKSLSIVDGALGEGHISSALPIFGLGYVNLERHQIPKSLELFRRATRIITERAFGVAEQEGLRLLKSGRIGFAAYLGALHAALKAEPLDKSQAYLNEALGVFQLYHANATSSAVAQMAVRFAATASDIGALIRQHEALSSKHKVLQRGWIGLVARPAATRDSAMEGNLQGEIKALEKQLASMNRAIADRYPAYAELTNPRPINLSDTEGLLQPDEALLTWVIAETGSYLMVVRRDNTQLVKLVATESTINRRISELRRSLDPSDKGVLTPFAAAAAFLLYKDLWEPAERNLAGVNNVYLVPTGPLATVPFSILLTGPPNAEQLTSPQDMKAAPWLIRKTALTTLPSISSLKMLRSLAGTSSATLPFLGIGDPLLEDHPQLGGKSALTRAKPSSKLSLFRGGQTDTDAIRKLPSLPETSVELEAMATAMKASGAGLLLREAANEPTVRNKGLEGYRVIAFATHGLLAGDLRGLTEPALGLTPPQRVEPNNDGLLTASEIATLKLDADWIVLSACNTATGEGGNGGDGLTGLAKAFFFAGARTLLVSHWAVLSQATIPLTTRTIEESLKPGTSRAEAHRKAMVSMIDSGDPVLSHPSAWAPFVTVGAGWATPGR